MTTLFITIFNMSAAASFVALAVMIIRLLLKKAPSIFSYLLWLAVLLRLVVPYSVNAPISLLGLLQMNDQTATGVIEFIPSNIGMTENPAIHPGADVINAVNSSPPLASPAASMSSMQFILDIASQFWIMGMIFLLTYSTVSYFKFKHHLRTATLIKSNIYETDRITTPFVCGFIKPKIYIPLGIKDQELTYILEHEQTHIRRRDYLIKPLAFLVLAVHWFNPIMWISYVLMSRDMEMSCDEAVIRRMGRDSKSGYSNTLLSFSIKNSGIFAGSPLAFGESQVQTRIKNVLNYKKPPFWISAAIGIVTLLLIIGFMINPAKNQAVPDQQVDQLTAEWANALKTRDGEPRYNMMSESMKDKFKQEQIVRSGDNWNFNIGDSSPWVVDYDISIEGDTATINYLTKSSEPATYRTEEKVTFSRENGKLVVSDYQTVYEGVPE